MVLAACGGGGGGGGGTSFNGSPVADAGADQNVDELTNVSLDGSGSSDPDGDNLTYSWSQTGGADVSLSNANTAQASFSSPNVAMGQSTTLTFTVRVTDPRGSSDTDTIDVVVNGVTNTSPVADAGADFSAYELRAVSLGGSAADDDIGDTLTYQWTQLSGPNVTLSNATQLNASFEAPDVGPAGQAFTFQLQVSDGTASDADTIVVTIEEPPPAVMVSGKVQYEWAPPIGNCFAGLDFDNLEQRPVRAAPIQLIEVGTGDVIDETVLDDNGDYVFASVPSITDYRLRVRAELENGGALPNWDVEVRDNTDTASGSLPNRALYVLDGATFNSGVADHTEDLLATDASRSSGPFAVLDAIYEAMLFVVSADPDAFFGPLDAFWSVNNTLTGATDIDAGELSASFYSTDPDRNGIPNPSLFLLGSLSTDTEEYDDHVIVHEWGHYFEDNFSRSDSIGGPHRLGDSIDARLAWGEGWASALAAMALNEPRYCDTQVNSGFGFNAETAIYSPRGWFNEISVVTFLYDLWDTTNESGDGGSIGWAPIYETMVGPQVSTPAYTTVFSFAAELRSMLDAGDAAFVDAQLQRGEIIPAGVDIWATNATNDLGGGRDVLPLYTDITAGGATVNICTNSDYDSGRDGNKLAEYRYFRINVPTTRTYTVTINTTTNTPATSDPDDRDQSDPDMYVWRSGQYVTEGTSGAANQEVFQVNLSAGVTYVADLQEWRFEDEEGAPDSFPDQICFDVTIAP